MRKNLSEREKALVNALSCALTQLRDLDGGYQEKELLEPLRATFRRGKDALRAVGFPISELGEMRS